MEIVFTNSQIIKFKIGKFMDWAITFLEINKKLKELHSLKLKNKHTEAYLLASDLTDLMQELEDFMQKDV